MKMLPAPSVEDSVGSGVVEDTVTVVGEDGVVTGVSVVTP